MTVKVCSGVDLDWQWGIAQLPFAQASKHITKRLRAIFQRYSLDKCDTITNVVPVVASNAFPHNEDLSRLDVLKEWNTEPTLKK